ncbi:peptidase M24, structural domain-containing protein [Myxozyma melibiosi]|uniref:Peptidase M24, structural domain-containing protein n=1 Tax=Myxozyma melibiosi TaxID=54550 RepID=A0ABR1F5H6_9ASCO
MTREGKYPAKAHAAKVLAHFTTLSPASFAPSTPAPLFLLASPRSKLWPFCDQSQPFRQNRFFYYLSGCNLPDCYLVFDTATGKLVLYLPEVDKDDVIWSGMPLSIDEAKAEFDVDDVRYFPFLATDLSALSPRTVFTIEDLAKTADDHTALLSSLGSKTAITAGAPEFLEALEEARLIKDDYELALMRKASEISDNAHYKVMSTLTLASNETHIHAEFIYHSIRAGSKNQSYDPICCSGRSCSTLHYIKNDEPLGGRQLVLLDAGAEWKNYASDVTRTFPIDGNWTTEALAVYELVAKMQAACCERVAPGVEWDSLHLLAHELLIAGFLELGIFKPGADADKILASRVSSAFFPHGLGHTLGMDTHDTAGRANYADPDPMFRYLRIRRKLEAGMVVTVEPGIYFSPFQIAEWKEKACWAEFVDEDVLDKYWDVGGVRIEDDVLVTEDGYENFTKITKDPEEISKIIKSGGGL